MTRYGIIVELDRCTGCMTCVIACKQENLTRPGVWWGRILQLEDSSLERIKYVRYACMHCEDPPCMAACSRAAIYRRRDGIVLIDHEKCEGQGNCVKACPYGAIDINPDQDYFPGHQLPYQDERDLHRLHPPGKAGTCTLCAHRIDRGQEPLCVVSCTAKALMCGDLDDSDSPVARKLSRSAPLLSSEGTRPKVNYISAENLIPAIDKRIKKNPGMQRP